MLMLLSENDSSDSQEDKTQTKFTQPKKSFWPKLFGFFFGAIMSKEVLTLVLTLITYYAMFVVSITKTNKVSPAQLFFTNSSCLHDYFDGDLGLAMKHAFSSDISAVLLYAPWDTDSQIVRRAYDVTCRFHSKQIKFLAMNCWHPGSACRAHFTKLTKFPALLIYLQAGSKLHVVQYKGHFDSDYMISFLDHIMSPVYKIDSVSHMARFKSNNDGLVVLCSDSESLKGSRLYKVFYSTAIKFLEYDPHRDVKFAVVLNQGTAASLTESWPALVLLNFNNSANYKGAFTEDKIIDWILGNLGSKPVNWIHLSGTKSVTLNYYLKNETSLVLFTPKNVLRNINMYYNLLKIVSAEFHKSCSSEVSLTPDSEDKYQILINYLVVNNIIEDANDKLLTDSCRELKMKIIEKIIGKRKLLDNWQLKKTLAKRVEEPQFSCNETIGDIKVDKGNPFGYVLNENKVTGVLLPVTSFPHVDLFNASTIVTADNFFPAVSRQTVPSLNFIDKYSITNLLYENSKQMCKLLRLAHRSMPLPILTELHSSGSGEWGHAFDDCATNKSLNFLSVDSKRYRYILENLNIDLSAYKDETLALIVDAVNERENIYLLSANITRDSLVVFVKDYLGEKLTRYKRNNDIGAHPVKSLVSLNRKFDVRAGNSTVQELNSANFYSVTHNSSANVLVLFYSKYCAHCLSFSHVYYLFSHILSHIRQLCFTRVDADTNDLLYPFLPVGFPALLLFPAGQAENSVSFDHDEPFTQSNFLSFLLREIQDAPLRVQVYLGACLRTDRSQGIECVSNVNKLIQRYIARDKVNVYKTYARFPPSSSSSINRYNLTVKLKKYLVRLKYYRSIQLSMRYHLLARWSWRKVSRYIRFLYSLYVKCDSQIVHIKNVYASLSMLTSRHLTRNYGLKEEL